MHHGMIRHENVMLLAIEEAARPVHGAEPISSEDMTAFAKVLVKAGLE